MTENQISREIVLAAIEVHRTLGGPGLLESVYEEALAWELQHRGLTVQRQMIVPILYKGVSVVALAIGSAGQRQGHRRMQSHYQVQQGL